MVIENLIKTHYREKISIQRLLPYFAWVFTQHQNLIDLITIKIYFGDYDRESVQNFPLNLEYY